MNFLFQGTSGRSIYIQQLVNAGTTNNGFINQFSVDRWTPDTPSAQFPRLLLADRGNNTANSDFWIRSGDYIRLKNIEIGYSLPSTFVKKLKLAQVRFYASGLNLLTFDHLDGLPIDPELPESGYNSIKSKPVETFVGGKDGLGLNVNATKTGYYMRRYLSESASWAGTTTTIRRLWIFFRYAEVLLNYAEALNEAQGVGAITQVLAAVNQILARTGVAMPALQTTNPAGNGYVGPTQAEIRKRIRNERRVELCVEEHRFYDVRRWKEGETTFNKPVTGMRIVQVTPTTLTYTPFVVENRMFTAKNYLYPISQNELNKAPKLGQNPGYQ